jgi:hypothetical protein
LSEIQRERDEALLRIKLHGIELVAAKLAVRVSRASALSAGRDERTRMLGRSAPLAPPVRGGSSVPSPDTDRTGINDKGDDELGQGSQSVSCLRSELDEALVARDLARDEAASLRGALSASRFTLKATAKLTVISTTNTNSRHPTCSPNHVPRAHAL